VLNVIQLMQTQWLSAF